MSLTEGYFAARKARKKLPGQRQDSFRIQFDN